VSNLKITVGLVALLILVSGSVWANDQSYEPANWSELNNEWMIQNYPDSFIVPHQLGFVDDYAALNIPAGVSVLYIAQVSPDKLGNAVKLDSAMVNGQTVPATEPILQSVTMAQQLVNFFSATGATVIRRVADAIPGATVEYDGGPHDFSTFYRVVLPDSVDIFQAKVTLQGIITTPGHVHFMPIARDVGVNPPPPPPPPQVCSYRDSLVDSLWHFESPTSQWPGLLGLKDVLQNVVCGKIRERVRVGVLDHGFAFGNLHPDIRANTDMEKSRISYLDSLDFHGANVAGAIGAAVGNGPIYQGYAKTTDQTCGIGIVGANPDITMVLVDRVVMGYCEGIFYLVDSCNVRVINCSFVVYYYDPLFIEYIHYAHSIGIKTVGGSGNCSIIFSPCPFAAWPAFDLLALSMGSCNDTGERSLFSNWAKVDALALGEGIFTTGPIGFKFPDDADPDSVYYSGGHEGTSFSCAWGTGLVSLIMAVRPDLPPETIDTLIMLSASGPDNMYTGNGVIRIKETIVAAMNLYCDNVPGDANADCYINLGDVWLIINFHMYGKPQPPIMSLADANCDGAVNFGDAIYLLSYLYRGGPAPVACDQEPLPVMNSGDSVITITNYPNPFNPTTTIKFTLPQPGEVKLSVYNILGQQVKLLTSGQLPAGTHKVNWDSRNKDGQSVASGIYFYRLQTQDGVVAKKMVLLK
jgi:hypothetical protein